ncbi:MAG: hypothetical protein U0Y82_12885 [Thermoleophilia bacterium]
MPTAPLHVVAFGDPACPWDFSAEPSRLRLLWRYGDAVTIEHRMVGLSSTPDEYTARGITPDMIAGGRRMLRDRYGMPMTDAVSARHVVTRVACAAVVGVRRHRPQDTPGFLRRLRVLGLTEGLPIDEAEVMARAAREAGLDPVEVAAWAAEPGTESELAADMAAARDPLPAALAQVERLAPTPGGGQRYTCPTYVMSAGGEALVAPGFQPTRVYEVLAANLAPHIPLRPTPTAVEELLRWAPHPLSTVEVAGVMEIDVDAARAQLTEAGAHRAGAGQDAYWWVGDTPSHG